MDTTTVDGLVADYLRRLEAAAARLPPDRRADLVSDVRDHLVSARAAGAGDEAAVRTVLDRLGDPDEIVAAAEEGLPLATLTTRAPSTAQETAAVLLLTVGSLLPVVGWLVGVVLLWSSRRWTSAEKLVGTLVVPFGPFGLLLLLAALPGQTCSSASTSTAAGDVVERTTCSGFALAPWVGLPLLPVLVVGPFVVGGLLLRRARARAATEPPVPRSPAAGWGAREVAAVALLGVGWLVLPIVGPLIGLVCAWTSAAWSAREKMVATVICAVGLVAPIALFVAVLIDSGRGPS